MLTKNQALLLGLILAFPETWQEEDLEFRTGLKTHAISVSLRKLQARGFIDKRGRPAKGLVEVLGQSLKFSQQGRLWSSPC